MVIYFRVVDMGVLDIYILPVLKLYYPVFFLRFIANLHETLAFLQNLIGMNADAKN